MVAHYKHFMVLYEERNGKIVVTSVIAHGNFQCMYGERVYDSLEDVKKDIDAGRYGP